MAYDRYAAALYGYCYWLLGDSADAAESLQDTFVLAATTRSGRPGPGQLRPWLFTLARNECRRGSGLGQRSAMQPMSKTGRPIGVSGSTI